MIKYDQTYSDYTDTTDANYPAGKAVDASSDESINGTPLKAAHMNNIIGMMQAIFYGVNGKDAVPSGEPEKVGKSDVYDAIIKAITDRVAVELAARKEADTTLQNNIDTETNARTAADSTHAALTAPHGATSEATAARLILRDASGRAKVAAPADSSDIARKADVDSVSSALSSHAGNTSNPHGVTKAQVGLGNCDNTADGSKSVAYAGSAGNADTVDGHHFNWSGQSGQPAWLFGGNDSANMYVYNPSNFSVNYANSAGSAPANGGNSDTVDGYHVGTSAGMLIPVLACSLGSSSGYIKLANGLIIQWGTYGISSEDLSTRYTIGFDSHAYFSSSPIVVLQKRSSIASGYIIRLQSTSTDSFIVFQDAYYAATGGAFDLLWIAIGG